MNDVKTCSGDLNSGISTNFFSVFRFILNLEKDIVKQNTCYVSGVYLFLFFMTQWHSHTISEIVTYNFSFPHPSIYS